jgi:Cupin-like domain
MRTLLHPSNLHHIITVSRSSNYSNEYGMLEMGQPTQDTKPVKLSRQSIVRLSDFTCIHDSNPFGVLPAGNLFFEDASSNRIGRREEMFDDKLWQHILSYCDGSSLGRTVQVSRYLYVAGHQSELWRDLVLRQCHATKSVISRMGRSWRDTYILLFHGEDKYVELQPMKIGIYSDSFYQSHLCRSFAIPSAWLEAVDVDERSDREVPSIPVEKISACEFFSRYEGYNQPVVVKGAAMGKAVEMWCNWDHLHRYNTNSKTFRTTSGAAPLPGNFTLKAYQKYMQLEYLEESPLYLFDRNAFASNQQWEDDFFPDFYQKCPYWDPSGDFGHDLLQHLGSHERPDHTWLIAGPKRSGSVFHIDPNCTHAWNACIQGRKRWIFYPPGDPPPGVLPSPGGDEVALPISVGEWIFQFWPEHMKQFHQRPVGSRPMECTTFPGDVIFVPHVSVSSLG